VRLAYADSPYFGCCGLYGHFHNEDGRLPFDGRCWDQIDTHRRLLDHLAHDYDGFILHLSAPSLGPILTAAAEVGCGGFRTMAWVKPFAAFKRNVSVAYAWEPVLVAPVRKPVVSGRVTMRDYFSEPITLRRGFTGAKPYEVCRWLFEVAGLEPDDEMVDLFHGSGAVADAHARWLSERTLEFA
jgi:hypothetical protein